MPLPIMNEEDEETTELRRSLLDPRLRDHLERARPQDRATDADYAAAMTKAFSQLGTIGGKSADTSAVSDMAAGIRKEATMDQQANAGMLERDAKLRQYLLGLKQQKQLREEDREARRKQTGTYEDASGNTRQGRIGDDGFIVQTASDPTVGYKKNKVGLGGMSAFDRKEAAKAEETEVYGATKIDGLKPTAKDAEKVKAAREARDSIVNATKRLDDLYAKHGTELYGDAAAEMGAISTDIQLNLKELQNLGVLNGPDLELLMRQVPDPSSMSENLKGMFGQDRVGAKRNSFVTSLEDKFETGLQARGYRRSDERLGRTDAEKGQAIAGPNSDAGMVKVISPDGKTGSIPRANLEKAKAKGFREAQ